MKKRVLKIFISVFFLFSVTGLSACNGGNLCEGSQCASLPDGVSPEESVYVLEGTLLALKRVLVDGGDTDCLEGGSIDYSSEDEVLTTFSFSACDEGDQIITGPIYQYWYDDDTGIYSYELDFVVYPGLSVGGTVNYNSTSSILDFDVVASEEEASGGIQVDGSPTLTDEGRLNGSLILTYEGSSDESETVVTCPFTDFLISSSQCSDYALVCGLSEEVYCSD